MHAGTHAEVVMQFAIFLKNAHNALALDARRATYGSRSARMLSGCMRCSSEGQSKNRWQSCGAEAAQTPLLHSFIKPPRHSLGDGSTGQAGFRSHSQTQRWGFMLRDSHRLLLWKWSVWVVKLVDWLDAQLPARLHSSGGSKRSEETLTVMARVISALDSSLSQTELSSAEIDPRLFIS